MVVTIEEVKKNLEYQETMNVDAENIARKNKKLKTNIKKLLIIHIFSNITISNRIFRPMQK